MLVLLLPLAPPGRNAKMICYVLVWWVGGFGVCIVRFFHVMDHPAPHPPQKTRHTIFPTYLVKGRAVVLQEAADGPQGHVRGGGRGVAVGR